MSSYVRMLLYTYKSRCEDFLWTAFVAEPSIRTRPAAKAVQRKYSHLVLLFSLFVFISKFMSIYIYIYIYGFTVMSLYVSRGMCNYMPMIMRV